MQERKLGKRGLEVSTLGQGARYPEAFEKRTGL
jgi:hypothetical protein